MFKVYFSTQFVIILVVTMFINCNTNICKETKLQSYFNYFFDNNVSGQINIFKGEKNDERKGFYYLLLPSSIRDTLNYKTKNDKVEFVIDYDKWKENSSFTEEFDFQKFPINNLDYKNLIDFKISLMHLEQRTIGQSELIKYIKEIESSLSIKHGCGLELWMNLEFLLIKMSIFFEIGRNEEASIVSNYVRFLIVTSGYKLEKYNLQRLYLFLANNVETPSFDSKNYFNNAFLGLDSIHNPNLELDFVSLRLFSLKATDTLEFAYLFEKGNQIISSNNIRKDKYTYFLEALASYYQDAVGDLDRAKYYLHKLEVLLDNEACSLPKTNNYLFLSQVMFLEGNIDSLKYYMERAKPSNLCNQLTEVRNEQYYYTVSGMLQWENVDRLAHNEQLVNALGDFKKVRFARDIIFTDKFGFHGYDAFSENCEDQLNLYLELGNIENHELDIIYLFEDSKARNLKVKKLRDAVGANLTGYRQLDDLNAKIIELNEKADSANYSDGNYKKIYFLNLEKQKLISNFLTDADFHLDTTKLKESILRLKRLNHAHLEIVKTQNYYWYYFINRDTFLFDSININKCDNLIKELRSQILEKKDYHVSNKLVRDLFHFQIPKGVSLSVSTDGIFNQLPFSLIFDRKSVHRNLGIPNSGTHVESNISYKDFTIFSYTDDDSNLQSAKGKGIKYSELFSGYESCLEIKNKLNITSKNLITGINFTKNKFIKGIESKGWHISTHAYSTPTSYFDNYFILRDKSYKPDSVFAYDILRIKTPPKFLAFSACDTGVGDTKIGAGNYSLTRSFFEIGTNTIISTLWKVNDRSSAYFFDKLYKHWVDGDISILSAYLKAKDDLRIKYPEPYHWAPFVLEGNPNIYITKK